VAGLLADGFVVAGLQTGGFALARVTATADLRWPAQPAHDLSEAQSSVRGSC